MKINWNKIVESSDKELIYWEIIDNLASDIKKTSIMAFGEIENDEEISKESYDRLISVVNQLNSISSNLIKANFIGVSQ